METNVELQRLAQRLGVRLSPRSVSGGYCYDGKTLGTNYQGWVPDDDIPSGDPHFWLPPTFLPELKPIMAEDLCHDLAHYTLCPSWARDLPEFGLMITVEYFNANGGYHLKQETWNQEGLFPHDQQIFFEERARLLGIYYCYLVQIPTTNDIRHWNPSFAPGMEFEMIPGWIADHLGISLRELQTAIAWTNDHPRCDVNPKSHRK